jgi:hypothetical protein
MVHKELQQPLPLGHAICAMSQIKYEYWIGILCPLEFGIEYFLLGPHHECHMEKKKKT